MAKHAQELTIELDAQELSSTPASEQDSGKTSLDSLLSFANTPTANKTKEEKIENSAINSTPSSLGMDGSNERNPLLPLPGVIVGKLVNMNLQGAAEVDFPGNALSKPLRARTTISLENAHTNQEVALTFENGDSTKPIILGILQQEGLASKQEVNQHTPNNQMPLNVQIDEDRLTFTAKKEIVLKCGKASITLTKAGKILIRGAYLLSRSTGVNRVKGGSVQIN